MTSIQDDWTVGHGWLQGLECPFAWRPSELLTPQQRSGIVDHLLRKEKELAEEKKGYTFITFVLKLLLGCELHAISKNTTEAMLKLEEVESALHLLDATRNNSFNQEVRRVQWHVIQASRAALLAYDGRLEESKEVLMKNFTSVSQLKSIEVGALNGIKSCAFLEYGEQAGHEALRWAKEAIKANPQEPEWYLLAGKAMEITRQLNESKLPEEEIAFLERAVTLSKSTHASLYLAAVYQHIVQGVFKTFGWNKTFKDSELYRQINNITRRTVQLYRESLQKKPKSVNVQVRCLVGMVKLPRQFLITEELKSIIDRVSKIPGKKKSFYNAAATFYIKIEKDYKKALQYLREGIVHNDFTCCLNLIRLRLRQRRHVDAEVDLMRLADRFKHDRSSYETAMAHLTSFYIFRDHTIRMAVLTANNVLLENPTSKSFISHRPMFVQTIRPLNLLVILLNEVRVSEVMPGAVQVEPRSKKKFLTIIDTYHPHMFNNEVDTKMIARIYNISLSLSAKTRRRMRFRRVHKKRV